MWCIPKLTPEFIERMEHLLDLYALPYNKHEPIVCIDEKSKQLVEDLRIIMLMTKHRPQRRDYEYHRNGTCNIFCAVEPKGGRRKISVIKRRTKRDFAKFVKTLVDKTYSKAKIVHIVCDNLNTHNEGSFQETFGKKETKRLMKRIRFHYTPKHASWLDMAEIELSVLSNTAIKGRIPDEKEDARQKMKYKVQT